MRQMAPPRENDRPKSVPLPIVWGDLTEKNVRQLQRLNATIFPVKYNDLFYSEAIKAPDGFVKLAYYNELLVGAICCRKEKFVEIRTTDDAAVGLQDASNSQKASLYIMTLGVLAPYRERGIGKQLITHVLNLVQTSPHCVDVVDVYLHVQDGNEEALQFYKAYGFEVKDKLIGYYKRITPADCFIVRKAVTRV